MKFLNWIIKIASLFVTSPVTVVVAGQVFIDIPQPWRTFVQVAAVVLVEGVFLFNWIALEHTDEDTPDALKGRYALIAFALYIGLWALSVRHGEGVLTGLVFRGALLGALIGTMYDAGVYTILEQHRRTESNIGRNWRVRRTRRKLDIRDKQYELQLDSTYRREVLDRQHEHRMGTVHEQAGQTPRPLIGQRRTARQTSNTDKQENIQTMLDTIRQNPDIAIKDLIRTVGVARSTLYGYRDELMEQGVLSDDWKVLSTNGHKSGALA